ncbi:DKNYY domain-containing protein [Novipirellula herctigrandis]
MHINKIRIIGLSIVILIVGLTYFAYRSVIETQGLESSLKASVKPKRHEALSYGFHVIDGQAAFAGGFIPFTGKRGLTRVKDADAETFRTFEQVFPEHHPPGELFAADKSHVFVKLVREIQILGADPATFRLLDEAGRFACDKDHVYYRAIKIEGADPGSFRRFKGDFSVDDNHAYLGHTTLPADAATFQASSPGYISNVWSGGSYHKGPYATEGWNRDANNVFFGNKRVDTIDPYTFEDLKFANYAKDAINVYWMRKIIAGADSKTFEVLGSKYLRFFPPSLEHPSGHGPFARDKNHFYSYTEIDERDGPWLHENGEATAHPHP